MSCFKAVLVRIGHASFLVVSALLMGAISAPQGAAQTPFGWRAHDPVRPKPPIVKPALQTLPVPPPSDALVLFDGSDLSRWCFEEGEPARWLVQEGYLEVVPNSGNLRTTQSFGDIQLHLEWSVPLMADEVGQHRANSGVLLMGKYEVQVLDSYRSDTYADGQAAAIYGQHPPLANACLAPGEWQTYDISFRRPRFDENGTILNPARISVVHNGVLVQDATQLKGPTAWLRNKPYAPHPDRLPLVLQDHGSPVRYRNIWLRELGENETKPPRLAVAANRLLPAEQVSRYTGLYETDRGLTFSVSERESILFFGLAGGQRMRLAMNSSRDFDLIGSAAHVRFAFSSGLQPADAFILTVGSREYAATRTRQVTRE